jgi:hypothetical protein
VIVSASAKPPPGHDERQQAAALPRVGFAVIDSFRQFEHVPASPGGVSEFLHGRGVVLDVGQVQEVRSGAG